MANIKTNGFYKSVNTQEGLYFNSNIKQPSVRLKLKDIKLNEKPAETQTSSIESEGKSPIDNNDSYIVNLRAFEDESLLIDLKVSVPSKKQANALCSKWKDDPSTIYTKIIQSLFDDND